MAKTKLYIIPVFFIFALIFAGCSSNDNVDKQDFVVETDVDSDNTQINEKEKEVPLFDDEFISDDVEIGELI